MCITTFLSFEMVGFILVANIMFPGSLYTKGKYELNHELNQVVYLRIRATLVMIFFIIHKHNFIILIYNSNIVVLYMSYYEILHTMLQRKQCRKTYLNLLPTHDSYTYPFSLQK